MADTGPCGPDSEIHLDRGPEFCDKADVEGHVCWVNGDCHRYLELWNLVFIQYNRTSPTDLKPLPARHVDTGLGFDRIVSILQGVSSNYRTDLFMPMIERVQELAGHSNVEREAQITPYRVIADHARAAAFLIADGVVPGNVGRNYVSRMIIRRASRFGSMIGLNEPFLAEVARTVIEEYGAAYPELVRNAGAITQTLTEEEQRFHRTIDTGISHLGDLMERVRGENQATLPGDATFELYATFGLPLEITRDIARENGLDVDEAGFQAAMEEHREASNTGDELDDQMQERVEVFQKLYASLKAGGKLPQGGVQYDPYSAASAQGSVLALLREGELVDQAEDGEKVGIVLPSTPFYVEAGGQVSDTGVIRSANGEDWTIDIIDTRQPVAGLVVHYGTISSGPVHAGDEAVATINTERRFDIMRNHTATHLLHAALREILGDHVRQAGSLVAPDRLRFDFTHSHAMSAEEIRQVEDWVNEAILSNYQLTIVHKSLKTAVDEGAMALFGETYGETVRTISIGDGKRISYELCGGTHVDETGVIGPFLVASEGSVAAGIRRIEALTGRGALSAIRDRLSTLETTARQLETGQLEVPARVQQLIDERDALHRALNQSRKDEALTAFGQLEPREVSGVQVLTGIIPAADAELLRELADRFRSAHELSAVVLGLINDGKPMIIAALSDQLVERGLHAGQLVKMIAGVVGGSGGGKPGLAQAGGKDANALPQALALVDGWLRDQLQ
jgi:alanyl-tRNA synthetase